MWQLHWLRILVGRLLDNRISFGFERFGYVTSGGKAGRWHARDDEVGKIVNNVWVQDIVQIVSGSPVLVPVCL
jgi:hypothetical protein